VADGLLDQTPTFEPLSSAEMELLDLLVVKDLMELPLQEFPEQMVVSKPLALGIERYGEEVALLQ
jgi:hypothetical protein